MAVSEFDKIHMSAKDLATADALTKQWEAAQKAGDNAGMNSAHSSLESVREQYKYAGGTDGSGYTLLGGNEPAKNGIVGNVSQADYINELAKAQQDAALAELKSAYDKNVIASDAAAAKIPGMYQGARNQTAATSEQNRAAFNERAAANGLNSGTGGQADLAMSNQLLGSMNTLNAQEANAKKDLETARLQMTTQYNNAIAQAIAEGNVEKAKMLYAEAVRVDQGLVAQSMAQADEDWRYYQQQDAKLKEQDAIKRDKANRLATFGDFSGFAELGYSTEEINRMYSIWAAKNPLLAQAASGKASFNGGGGGGGNGGGNITPAPKPKDTPLQSGVDSEATLSTLNGKLTAIEDKKTGVEANVVQIVKSYLENGLISEKTANSILANYGL